MGLKNITKILALFLSLQLFTSCGLKALVIPNLDWLLKRKLASELSLNSEQKKQLKEDIKVFLEDRKGQAQRLSKKIKKLPLEKLNATKLSEEFFVEYKDFLKAFLPLYSKYLAQLEKEQLKDLEETFAEKNREIKERVDDFDIDRTLDRYQEFFGDLSPKQIEILKANADNFQAVAKERLERRRVYQKSLLKILSTYLPANTKKKQIESLSWDYNTKRSQSAALKLNTQTTQAVFDLIDKRQRQHLEDKLADIQSWIGRFLEENYL